MTIRPLLLASLAIPGLLAAAEKPSQIAVIPLNVGENYRLSLPVRINGAEFSCNIDSGGGDLIYLDKAKALAAGIQPIGEGYSAGPQAASMNTDLRAQVTLEIGALKLPGQELVMQNRPSPDYQCTVGLQTLKQYVVELSYQPPALRVHAPDRYVAAKPGHAIPFVLEGGNAFVQAVFSLPNGSPIPARLAIDTGGDRSAVYLSKSFVDQHNILDRVPKTVPDLWSGSSAGLPRVLAARFDKLQLGDVELPHPIAFLARVPGFGGVSEPDGLLCPDFLRRFNVTFDYPHRKLILEPGPHFADEAPFDSSGALIYREGQNPYRVLKVIPGSPAAEAGLQPGDILLDLDGRLDTELSMGEIRAALESAGRECSLHVQRGTAVFGVKLKLRPLI
ncbi:MAG: PDZ domain-containing protein [Bryobacteraceae bacterium]